MQPKSLQIRMALYLCGDIAPYAYNSALYSVLNILGVKKYNIPVIVLTANIQRDMIMKVFKHGVKSYISKPFEANAIIAKTLDILKASL